MRQIRSLPTSRWLELNWLTTLAGLGAVVAIGWLIPYLSVYSPAMILVLIMWVGALATIMLSIRSQLVLFWALLPFINLLKRLVFLDEQATITQMYLVLATQDIILGIVIFKLLLRSLSSGIRVRVLAVDLAVIAFGLYSVLSAMLLSSGAPLAARLATVESHVWPMTMYFLAAYYLSQAEDVKRLSGLTIGLAVVVALYGIHQFYAGLLPFEEAWIARATTSSSVVHLQYDMQRSVFRTFATLDSHGPYGIFLGIGIISAWARRFRLGGWLWLVTSLVLAAGLVLSYTRYTWIMPPIAAAFVFLFQYRRIKPLLDLARLRRSSLLLLLLIGSLFIFYVFTSNLYGTRLVTSSNPYLLRALSTSTLYARIQWADLISPKAIGPFGSGLAARGYFASKFGFETQDVNFHNIFIDMMEGMGLIGVGIFIVLLYLMFKRAIFNMELEHDPQRRRLLVALFGLVLAMLMVGHFNGAMFYHGRAIPYYFWGFCGILIHYGEAGLNAGERLGYESTRHRA